MNAQDAIRIAHEVFGAHSLELLKREMSCATGTRGHAIAYAENAQGETVGKRDTGPWAEYRRDGVGA